ncbi:MAG TPA: sugar phosphate nucleotidyltransferase [Candidatus Nanoarchaeia archaeon]|nr:sugar phosphate nucleotidyltransferase [Candidatus Nanoarchaeia archaeon]
MKKISLVYMLAGLSSRFGGKAKAFAKVGPGGETLLEYSLNQALLNGFKKIIFIVSHKTEKQFRDYFGNSYRGIPIVYALQEYDESLRVRPWGTNDALCSAKDLINGPFVICNGDDIYGEEVFSILFDHLNENKNNMTLGYKLGNVMPDKGAFNRGIFEEENGFVKKITETLGIEENNLEEKGLNKNDLCSMNLFGLRKETLDMLYEKLVKFKEEHKNNPKIECYLPTELNNLISEGKIKMKIYETDESCLGVTNPEDESILRDKLKLVS